MFQERLPIDDGQFFLRHGVQKFRDDFQNYMQHGGSVDYVDFVQHIAIIVLQQVQAQFMYFVYGRVRIDLVPNREIGQVVYDGQSARPTRFLFAFQNLPENAFANDEIHGDEISQLTILVMQ